MSSSTSSRSKVVTTFAFTLMLAIGLLCAAPFSSFASPNYSTAPSYTTYGNQYGNSWSYYRYTKPSTPTYADSRWPTTNSDLLAIPESQRWYNAWDSAGTYCTIAGPVVKVYQAKSSAGAPIFIDIGAAYPNTNSVTMLVWGDQYYEFAEMINAVERGNAWLSVTGYLSVYNGYMQFDAGEGYLEYTWWTNVR